MTDLASYCTEDTLRNGRSVLIRAIRKDDKQALRDGFRRLSMRSVQQRFFRAKRDLTTAELEYFTEPDFVGHVSLVAIIHEEGREIPIGVGRFATSGHGASLAELALTVDDMHQGQGAGTLLLKHLVRIARSIGVGTFSAWVLADNRQVLEVLVHSGLPITREPEPGGIVKVTMTLTREIQLPAVSP